MAGQAPSSSGRFEELARTGGVVYGACAGIWIMTLFAEPTLRDMRGARPTLQAMSRRHPEGFPTLAWILPQAGYRMASDARHEASTVTREFDAAILAQATLIEGTGFQVATVRAIVAGVDLMSRHTSPKKVFSDVQSAVAWCLARRAGATGAAAGAHITASLLEVRSSLLPPG